MKAVDLLLVAAVVAAVALFGASKAWAEPAAEAPPPDTTATTVDPSAPPTSVPGDSAEAPGVEDGRRGGSGFFDFVGRARDAINGWFAELAKDALNPALELLGRTVLSTPNFTGPGRVRDLWHVSWGIANGVFVLFILGAGVLGMSHETLQTRHALKELLPRLVVAFVAANASLFLAGLSINIANALTEAFAGQGVGSAAGAAQVVATMVLGALAGGGIFVTLVSLAVAVLVVGLLGTYVVRVATMVVLVAAAPLFLIGHALPGTDGAARLWWRALAGCLAVQVGQSFVLVTAVRVLFDADGRRSVGIPGGPLMDLLVVGCLFWMMLRIPAFARRLVFNARPNAGAQTVRHVVTSQAVGAARTALKAAAA